MSNEININISGSLLYRKGRMKIGNDLKQEKRGWEEHSRRDGIGIFKQWNPCGESNFQICLFGIHLLFYIRRV